MSEESLWIVLQGMLFVSDGGPATAAVQQSPSQKDELDTEFRGKRISCLLTLITCIICLKALLFQLA